MTERVPVLVTAVGGNGFGAQILKALLLAPGSRYDIVGSDADDRAPALRSVGRAVRFPFASDPSFVDLVLDACDDLGIRALLPGSEPELRRVSEEHDRFASRGILVLAAQPHVLDTCLDKGATAEFLTAHGLSPPRSHSVSNWTTLPRIDFFPVVVKPIRGAGGSRDCYIAQDEHELQLLTSYIGGTGSGFLVQEYVGTPADEYTVGVLHDMDGRFVNSIALRRELVGALHVRTAVANRSPRIDLGPHLVVSSGVSHGTFGDFPEVREACEQIARALDVRGPINVQCRLVDGVVRVFEINPRFSGTTSVRALVGYNEPDVLLRQHLFGERAVVRFPYRHATVLRTLREDVVASTDTRAWPPAPA